jgi:hypothetical protein
VLACDSELQYRELETRLASLFDGDDSDVTADDHLRHGGGGDDTGGGVLGMGLGLAEVTRMGGDELSEARGELHPHNDGYSSCVRDDPIIRSSLSPDVVRHPVLSPLLQALSELLLKPGGPSAQRTPLARREGLQVRGDRDDVSHTDRIS